MKVLAVYNLKGGVGKTSTAVNLAYLASSSGLNTLIWDLDPQGASSWYFESDFSGKIKGKKVLEQKIPLCRLIQKTRYPNLHIVPADISFAQFDVHLENMDSNKQLSKVLAPFNDNYSLIILDCPPGLTRLTENIFDAMDAVLLPVIPTWLSLRSYDQLRLFLSERSMSHKQIYPFFSMVDFRKKLHQNWLHTPPAQVKKLLSSYISYSTLVEKMGEHKLPVELFAAKTPVAASYRTLWKEIKSKLKL
jgi:chromosome partitioning protein